MHQKPFVGRTLPGPPGGAYSAPKTAYGLERTTEEGGGREEGKESREAGGHSRKKRWEGREGERRGGMRRVWDIEGKGSEEQICSLRLAPNLKFWIPHRSRSVPGRYAWNYVKMSKLKATKNIV